MTLSIELSDRQAKALLAKANAEGFASVQAWIQNLAEPEQTDPVGRPLHPAAQIILDSMRDMQAELKATMPVDGASQVDHHIYGWPKREA